MATTVIGSVAINPLLAILLRNAGQLGFGPVAIPAGYTDLSTIFDLQQVNSLTAILLVEVQVSFDSGANWTVARGGSIDLSKSGFVLNGSILTRDIDDPSGPGPVRCSMIHTPLPQCDLSTRQIKGKISSSESLISGITIVAI